MNQKSEQKNRGEYENSAKLRQIAETGDEYTLYKCLLSTANDGHINARWGNVVDIYTAFKNAVEEQLMSYEAGETDALTVLNKIADAGAIAKNDQRDGLLLIDELFGVPERNQPTELCNSLFPLGIKRNIQKTYLVDKRHIFTYCSCCQNMLTSLSGNYKTG